MKKEFDKDLHKQYDNFGKTKVIKLFKDKFKTDLVENEDIYGVDLVAYKNNKKIGYVEVEVRNSWSSKEFPFDSLNVPERKDKLLLNDMKTYFVSVNKDGTKAFICTAKRVLKSPLQESKNKYVQSGEKFFKVDLNEMVLVDLI
jgi:hypothetical protein